MEEDKEKDMDKRDQVAEPAREKKSVDQEWAETLGLEIREQQTPPPVIPPVPDQSGAPAPETPRYQPAPEPPRYQQGPQPGCNLPPDMPRWREPMPPTYMLWAILSTLCCCIVPGVVAIYFSAMVSSRYYEQNYEGARRASRNAEIWIIVSVVLGVISSALYVPFMLMGIG